MCIRVRYKLSGFDASHVKQQLKLVDYYNNNNNWTLNFWAIYSHEYNYKNLYSIAPMVQFRTQEGLQECK